jgi:rubrerythrin
MSEHLCDNLWSLAQLDRDVASVYGEALKHVTDDDIAARFREFRGEHERHVSGIAAAVEHLGGKRRELEAKGLERVAPWVGALRAMGGQHSALSAMRAAEKYHSSRYHEAMAWASEAPEIESMLRRFRNEEARHLAFIESSLGLFSPDGDATS